MGPSLDISSSVVASAPDKLESAARVISGNNWRQTLPRGPRPCLHTMSQNVHTLHLFFEDSIRLKYCQLVFQYLQSDNTEQAERWAEKLGGADLAKLWDSDWFNPGVRTQGPGLVLNFDSSTHDGIPLQMLEELFAHGLRSAVAEVFYDQVGETERMFFEQGMWVSRPSFYASNPTLKAVVERAEDDTEERAGEEDEEGASDGTKNPRKPVPIGTLRTQQEDREREGREAVEAMVGMFKDMRESGVNPVDGVMGIFMLKAGFKGLVHAALFTLVTVLLFKGFWLWMGLGLLLAVALPLYYMNAERKSLFS